MVFINKKAKCCKCGDDSNIALMFEKGEPKFYSHCVAMINNDEYDWSKYECVSCSSKADDRLINLLLRKWKNYQNMKR